MGFVSILGYTQKLVKERLREGDYAIDGTMGNGVDTLFLAQTVGPKGRVFAFDIQSQALENTSARLKQSGCESEQVQMFLKSHAEMEQWLPAEACGNITAIMFNFGYLPGADEAVITQPDSSIQALEAAMGLLRPGGLITAVVYPGHEGGQQEAAVIERWASELPHTHWKVLSYRFINIKSNPPYLLAIEKKRMHD